MSDAVIIAIISSIPATLAACGALVYGRWTHNEVKTKNGSTTGEYASEILPQMMVEHAELDRIRFEQMGDELRTLRHGDASDNA